MIVKSMAEYKPNEDEAYMNSRQLSYFRSLLTTWRTELVVSSRSFEKSLQEVETRKPDPLDQSAAHTEITLDFQARSRQQRLIRQIDYALDRIEDGEYGYCEITGEEIGLRRLMARPVATMCVEVQEQYERTARSRRRYEIAALAVEKRC